MKFNNTQESVAERTETENHEGAEAFDPDSPELGLVKVVINNLLEDTFYESDESALQQVESRFNAVADSNPEFALKLAKYARQEENLRQIPQALLVLAVEDERTRPFVEDYATGIMSRTDEPLEVLALWTERNGSSIPGVLKRSIESAMHTWNEWQYAKWDQPNKEFQYRDLLNLVHPAPQDEERSRIFEKIAYGELDDHPDVEPLKQTDTWESAMSGDTITVEIDVAKGERASEGIVHSHGATGEWALTTSEDNDSAVVADSYESGTHTIDLDLDKTDTYRHQLAAGNMGIFPRVRQARDMLESGVSADRIFDSVTDEWIRNSRLYPFRFYQAYKAVRGGGVADQFGGVRGSSIGTPDIPEGERTKALEYLEHFMDVATENLPDVLEDTFVAVDTSGSMASNISSDSSLQCVEIGALFGGMLYRRGADLGVVATEFKSVEGDRRSPTVTIAEAVTGVEAGGATNGYLVPEGLRNEGQDSYNQIIIFTDMQMWNNTGLFGRDTDTFRDEWNKYKEFNPDASLYIVDLASYGDLVTPEGAHDVYNISGWSENVIDYIDKMENVDGMVQEIESVTP